MERGSQFERITIDFRVPKVRCSPRLTNIVGTLGYGEECEGDGVHSYRWCLSEVFISPSTSTHLALLHPEVQKRTELRVDSGY
jgi:hypothetical protein